MGTLKQGEELQRTLEGAKVEVQRLQGVVVEFQRRETAGTHLVDQLRSELAQTQIAPTPSKIFAI